ncbi:hypothetical protein [Acidiferrobacter thiooxydans]|jgi:3-mercaptopyruvate sulfurtransferase SseA|uniref:Uncharacterized protein n=1 Tax=Acidiferrobacter thiooxydans TaxID=163359 RepID=A0A368HKC8_9GAMM|nr:hypothetical protein [Acidiferrobacter thiooxydans]MDA8191291.1 hypothetical protein [Gammaproteobacteria bacterium]MDA8191295.1 hypothetical protein [Gammaproteobacteria bacterium]RCN58918.1 hypothetical protein C4900_03940 [Acidiferrobacter thiooxydans]
MGTAKTVVVLGRHDHTEAMRVAAGLTIFGHTVRLILMGGPVADTPENAVQAESLELADVQPETTVPDQGLPYLDTAALATALATAEAVISL